MIEEYLKPENISATVVCIGLILLAIFIHVATYRFMKSASERVLAPLDSVDLIQYQIIEKTLEGNTLKLTTLKNQYLICEQIKKYYKGLGISYYTNYFAFSICSIIFVTLLTIAVFLIANIGWQGSDLVHKSFFLTTIALSSIYYFLPSVLNNKENLKKNTEKVIEFEKIQLDILSFSNKIELMDIENINDIITSNYENISTNLDFLNTIDDSKLINEMNILRKNYSKKL